MKEETNKLIEEINNLREKRKELQEVLSEASTAYYTAKYYVKNLNIQIDKEIQKLSYLSDLKVGDKVRIDRYEYDRETRTYISKEGFVSSIHVELYDKPVFSYMVNAIKKDGTMSKKNLYKVGSRLRNRNELIKI